MPCGDASGGLPPPDRRRRLRPRDRMRQPLEPAPGPHQRATAGVRGAGRARRAPPSPRAAGAHGEPAAGGRRLARGHAARGLGHSTPSPASRPSASRCCRTRASTRWRSPSRSASRRSRASRAACYPRSIFSQRPRQDAANATHQRSASRSSAPRGTPSSWPRCAGLHAPGRRRPALSQLQRLLQVQLGFQPQHAMAWRVDDPRRFASNAERASTSTRAAARSGVARSRVGRTERHPAPGPQPHLGRGRRAACSIRRASTRSPSRGSSTTATCSHADPARGRTLLRRERQREEEKAVIINESLARRLWPDRDALGQKIDVNGGSTVIGVVADVRHGSLEEAGGNEMYLDYRQIDDWNAIEMVVRSSRPPPSLVPEVRAALGARSRPAERRILRARPAGRQRGGAPPARHAAARALLRACAGPRRPRPLRRDRYSVVQRRQEIGIRMAIGAQRTDVVRLVIASGLKLVAVGIALGLAGALALTRLLQSLLFGVTAHDPCVLRGTPPCCSRSRPWPVRYRRCERRASIRSGAAHGLVPPPQPRPGLSPASGSRCRSRSGSVTSPLSMRS